MLFPFSSAIIYISMARIDLSMVNWLRSSVCLARSQEYCLGSSCSSSSSLPPSMNRRQGKETWRAKRFCKHSSLWIQSSPCIPCFCHRTIMLSFPSQSSEAKSILTNKHHFKRQGASCVNGCGHTLRKGSLPANHCFPHKEGKADQPAGTFIDAR